MRANLSMLRAILLDYGWEQSAKEAALWRSPSQRVFAIPDQINSETDLESVWRTLLELDEDLGAATLRTILTPVGEQADILYLSPELRNLAPGQIWALSAPEYYRRVNSLLRSAVQSERRKPLQGDPEYQATSNYLRRVKFGTVTASSYRLAIHLPLEPHQLWPIGRRVWRRLQLCVDTIGSFNASTDETVLETEQIQVWTPQLCESVAEYVEQTQCERLTLEVERDLTHKWTDATPILRAEAVIEPGEVIEGLGRTAGFMRGIEENKPATIEGFVHELKDPSLLGRSDPRLIKIQWEGGEQGPLIVQIKVTEEVYRQMIQAHDTRKPIQVSGYLVRRGTHWYLEDAAQFKLL